MRNFIPNLLIGIATFGYYPMVKTQTHRGMTQDNRDKHKFIPKNNEYNEWKTKFDTIDWTHEEKYPTSLFTIGYTSQCHASLFEIEGDSYRFDSLNLFLANRTVNKKIKEITGLSTKGNIKQRINQISK